MSSMNKKILRSKSKIKQNMLDIERAASSNNSVSNTDSFMASPKHSRCGVTPMGHSKYSIRVNSKKKTKDKIAMETLAKEIDNVNEKVDPSLQYFEKDLDELNEHTTIRRKTTDWGHSISPEFLIGLKIKQRQKEYWKKRISRDFSPSLESKKKKRRYELQGFTSQLASIEEKSSSKRLIKLNKCDD